MTTPPYSRSYEDAWVRGVSHVGTLHGHYGCVNRMTWFDDGDRLASVSDDCDLLVWRGAREDGKPWQMAPELRIATGHSANVFGVAALGRAAAGALPNFVTGGMDGEVRLHSFVGAPSDGATGGSPAGNNNGSARSMRRLMLDARRAMRGHQALGPPPTDAYSSRLVYSHRSMVKSVQGAGESPYVFFSAAEDGTVCQFDVRTLGAAGPPPRETAVIGHPPATHAPTVTGTAPPAAAAAPTSLAGTIAALSASAAATTASAVESSASAIVRRHTRNVLITMSTSILRGTTSPPHDEGAPHTNTNSSSSRHLTTVDERIWRTLATRRLIRSDDDGLTHDAAHGGSAAAGMRRPAFAAVTSLKHMATSAANPYLLLTAGGDPYLRLYDRRMLPRLDHAGSGSGSGPRAPVILASPSTLHSGYRSMHENVLRFAPLHLGANEDIAMGRGPALAMPGYPTYCEFDDTGGGDRLLGTYHGDGVYVFDCRQSDVAGGVVVDALPLGAGVATAASGASSCSDVLPASSSKSHDVASAALEGGGYRWPKRQFAERARGGAAAFGTDSTDAAASAAAHPEPLLLMPEACEVDDLLGDGVPAPAQIRSSFVSCKPPPAGEPAMPLPVLWAPPPAPGLGRGVPSSSKPASGGTSGTAPTRVTVAAPAEPAATAAVGADGESTADGLPTRVRALQLVGTDHFRGGRFTEAATCYSLAIELMRATLMRPGAAMMIGAPATAAGAALPAEASALETALALLLTNRAICLVKRAAPGDGASAVADCSAALRLVPDRWKARMWLARALDACGRHRDALDVMLSFYRQHDPRHPHSVADALRSVGVPVEPLVGPMPELEGLVPVDLEYALEGTQGWLTEQVARMRSAAAAAAAAAVRRRAVDEAQRRASDEKDEEAEDEGAGDASASGHPSDGSASGGGDAPLDPPMPLDDLLCVRHEARLTGHVNLQTDIKEAAFMPAASVHAWRAVMRNAALAAAEDTTSDGSDGGGTGDRARQVYHSAWGAFASGRRGYVVAGSDHGKAVIYDLATGLPVTMLDADADVCNAVRPNPRLPVLATSGIEDVIRLWAPPPIGPTLAAAAAATPATTAATADRPHAAVSASSPAGCRAIEDWMARHGRGDDDDDDDDAPGGMVTMQALLRHLARAEGGPFVLRPSQGDDEEPPGPGDVGGGGGGATVIPCATQ